MGYHVSDQSNPQLYPPLRLGTGESALLSKLVHFLINLCIDFVLNGNCTRQIMCSASASAT